MAAAAQVDPSHVAERTGSTGVQRNAAIPDRAPQLDYWAVNAGDGARLDGKQPASLKDREGNEVDVRRMRAEAAAERIVIPAPCSLSKAGIIRKPAARNRPTVAAAAARSLVRN